LEREAGLAATARLKAAGKNVVCLEATNRVGGRILTVKDPLAPLPIELGAEFVHGLPPQTWDVIRAAGLSAYEHTSHALRIRRGRILNEKRAGEIADHVVSQIGKSARKTDESFEDYLRHSRQPAVAKDWARVYIEGFNAARKELISIASLAKDAIAAEKIDGDRVFKILNGYDSVPISLLRSIPDYRSVVHLNSLVERVNWRRGSVEVHYTSTLDGRKVTLRCRRLIVTVPLGVLQAPAGSRGAICFDPQPCKALRAVAALQFGHVYRMTFRFETAFWQEDPKLKHAGFLISKDKGFFTWWTTHPIISPMLTGWSAGSAADQFQSLDEHHIAARALGSLARILGRPLPRPEAVYFHNWQTDPFFRDAYSYVPVNALPARKALAVPVEDTLFFAGEATELNGNAGTVHGAIASGIRAAELAQAPERRKSLAAAKYNYQS
jgi:monoamine oxidase